MDDEQQQKADLIEELKKTISDVSVTISGNNKVYEFTVGGASLKSFKRDYVKLTLKCEANPPTPSKKDDDKKIEQPQPQPQPKPAVIPAQPKKPEPKPQAQPEPEKKAAEVKPKQTPKLKTKTSSNKNHIPAKEQSPIAPAQSLEAKHVASGAAATVQESKHKETESADAPSMTPKLSNKSSSNNSNKKPRLRKGSSAKKGKSSVSKCIFGTLKSGREKRIHIGNANTFKGCEYIPQFKGSERGCVLKKSNKELEKRGIVKKSQVEKFNGIDITGESLKKIKKMIGEYAKLDKDYGVQFEIPQIDLNTTELTFNGVFCAGVEFTKEYDGNNMIIKDIPQNDSNKYLVNKAELKAGYRVFKVKGSNVLNKPYEDISKELDKAGKDRRVSYQVVFIEGKMDWFSFTDPNPYNDDEKKIDLPEMKSNKSSNKSPRKTPKSPRKTPKSPRKTPKSPRRTPKTSMSTPLTPSTPSGKNPKYFLRDKKNVNCYFDIRIDGDKRGRIEIVVFMGIVPKTATNFVKLCTGDNKKKLSYKGKKFYKMYIGMGLEGGDVEKNDGKGASSIYGGYFPDENFKIRNSQYCLTMVNNDEPDTNASQFYIMVAEDAEYLDGKNVVFGYVADKQSQELIDDMEEEGCSLTGKPKCKVVIAKCGKLKK